MATTRPMIVSPIYSRILSKFPHNFTFCFAYGSAVKKQLSNKDKENMIDLIYCVNDAANWHELNMKENFSHYSGLKYFGHNFISKFQENFGAKVYFNTLVPIEEVWIKYGVVSTQDLVTDLLEWSDLYLAGRLHKPVEIIKKPSSSELQTALTLNLQSAVHAALLLLPESFSEYQFYYTISNLSYVGDFRMVFGENKNKVENIVKPQLLGFRSLYGPFLKTLQDYVDFPVLQENDKDKEVSSCCYQDLSPLARLHHLNQLPRWPQKALTRFWNKGILRQDTEDVLRALAYDPDCHLIVQKCISDIVFKSSVGQSLKSIVTAGIFKSVKYSSRKKMYKCSDSESHDSDEGIRYKTDSTRNKQVKNEKRCRSPSQKNEFKRSNKNTNHKRERSSSNESFQKKTDKESKREKGVDSDNPQETVQCNTGIGPIFPPHLLKKKSSKEMEIPATIGPTFSLDLLKKNTSSEEKSTIIGPALPYHLLSKTYNEDSTNEDVSKNQCFGPQLPPHLLNKKSSLQESCIGPQLHTLLSQKLQENSNPPQFEVIEDEDVYGPLPVNTMNYSKAQVALEERALQLKMNQLKPNQTKAPVREEWMLELPEVKAAKLGPRQFRNKAGPDLSDRSSWTDTPNKKAKSEEVDLKKVAEMMEIQKRDEQQQKIAMKHKKKNKESLLKLHQNEMKKKKKEEGQSERRPFSREIDLKVNRFDEAQKNAVLKKAQLLDDRFSSGQSKFL